MSYSNDDLLYGFYYDIESNHVLNDNECVMFIPTAPIKTEFHQNYQPVIYQPVVKEEVKEIVTQVVKEEVKEKELFFPRKTTTSSSSRQITVRQITNRQITVKQRQDFISQNCMKLSFCIFIIIILF